MKNLIFGMIIGLIFPYLKKILDIISENLENKSVLKANEIQNRINLLNDIEKYDDPHRIGFEIPTDEELIDDEFKE